MKIVSMKCPHCQGNLDISEEQKGKFTTCPFCGTKFLLEEEQPDINQTINIKEVHIGDTGKKPAYTRNKANNATTPLVVIFCIVASVLAILIPQIMSTTTTSSNIHNDTSSTTEEPASSPFISFVTFRTKPESEAVINFVETAFGKPLSEIKKTDYESIKYLKVEREALSSIYDNKTDSTPWIFTYAKKVGNLGSAVKPVTVKVPGTSIIIQDDFQVFTEVETLDFSDESTILPAGGGYIPVNFTNLKKLHYYGSTSRESIKTMPALNINNIYSLGKVFLNSIDKDIEELKHYKNLKVLNFKSLEKGNTIKDLSFLSSFPNVDSLSLAFYDEKTWDLAGITSLTKLKTLFIRGNKTKFEHFNVLSGMPQIENLSFEYVSELKTLDFAKNMPYLKSLSIDGCPVIGLNGLKGCLSLTSLELVNCSDLIDVNALTTLTSLKNLSLAYILNYNISIPKLNKLTALSDVTIRSRDLNIIAGNSSIKKLTIMDIGTNYSFKPLAGLNNLEELSIYEYDRLLKADMTQYLAKLPKLRTINFGYGSIAHYGDYTGVFSLPQVTKITMGPFYKDTKYIVISVNNLKNNKVLKELDLSGIEIYNKDVDNGSTEKFGVYANKILSHFPNLRKLNLSNTHIDNLDFVDKMPSLEELDISKNYVTDISKLLKLKKLKKLTCDTDIIVNLDLLPESVKVMK